MPVWINTEFIFYLPDEEQADYLHFDIEHTMESLEHTEFNGVYAADFAAEARLDDFLISDEQDLGFILTVKHVGNKVYVGAHAPWNVQTEMWRAFFDKYYADIPIGIVCWGYKKGKPLDES